MSCQGQYIKCPPIPFQNVMRGTFVLANGETAINVDVHQRPVEALINCENSSLTTEQLLGLCIAETSEGLPVLRVFECY